jgi:hypothetical protein
MQKSMTKLGQYEESVESIPENEEKYTGRLDDVFFG